MRLLIAIFVQNLVTAMLYVISCELLLVQIFFSVFLTHVSIYTIAIIGIDRYVRIKHYKNFNTIWTKKSCIYVNIHSVFSSSIPSSNGDHRLSSRGSIHY